MSYSSVIMESIMQYPELKIIDTQKVYKERFCNVPEQAFYQAVSRMAKSGEIQRISKGVYCKPKKGRFGMSVSSEKNILEHYIGAKNNKGVLIGYRMYNRNGLTTQVSKTIEIYSNVTLQEKKQIRNVLIHKANVRFDTPTVKMIELLEVLQNHKNIEDLNKGKMIGFIEKSVQYYEDRVLQKLLRAIGYKKSTLASLKNILDFFKIENTINQYLNGTSRYTTLSMEELYETTS